MDYYLPPRWSPSAREYARTRTAPEETVITDSRSKMKKRRKKEKERRVHFRRGQRWRAAVSDRYDPDQDSIQSVRTITTIITKTSKTSTITTSTTKTTTIK